MAIAFNITSTPSAYYSGVSILTFEDVSDLSGIVFRSWDLGDKTFASTSTVSHLYTLPGTYKVVLTLVDNLGVNYTLLQEVVVRNYIENQMEFITIPPPSEQGEKQIYPFRISLSASDTAEHIIDLYAQFSKSSPYIKKDPNRWFDLQPHWRFLDINGNVINSIKTVDTFVRINPSDPVSTIMGVTGYADFYYVDDIPSTDPIILWATLQLSAIKFYDDKEFPGYSNSKIQIGIPYYIDAVEPTKLFITESLTNEIHPIKWIGGSIPHLITLRGRSVYQLDSGIENFPIILNFPSLTTSASPVSRTIFGQSSGNYVFDGSTSSFVRNSPEGYDTGGFIKSNVKVLNSAISSTNAQIQASVDITSYGTPRSTPYAWISNPANSILNRVEFGPSLSSEIIKELEKINISGYTKYQIIAEVTEVAIPSLTAAEDGPMDTTGYAGIYGIAVDPAFNVWATDSELDRIYKFDSTGQILSSIQLELDTEPTSICLDSDLNLYVACSWLYDVIKLDRLGNILNTIYVPNISALSAAQINPDLSGVPTIDDTIVPVIVETDSRDNLWIGYSNPSFNALIRFDKNGVYADHVVFELYENPVDMVYDSFDDTMWVVLAHINYGIGGSIVKFDNRLNVVSAISLNEPYYIAQDLERGIWVTYEYDKLFHLNPNNTTHSYTLFNTVSVGNNLENASLEGLACDAQNRIWVLDSINNNAYVLSQTVDSITRATLGIVSNTLKMLPDANLEQYISPSYRQFSLSANENASIQAIGDWTGFKWHQKYMGYHPGITKTETITGSSDIFNLMEFKNPYDIRRFNESFDIIDYIKKLPMPELLLQNNNYFDQFLGYSIGGNETENQAVGRLAYERAANFVANHGDIDTCGITQLYSIADKNDITISDYNLSFPPELRRIMDIISISHSRLWGGRSINAHRFKDDFSCCSDCKPINKGPQLDFFTDYLTAGDPVVTKEKFSDVYNLLPVYPLDSNRIFPLSSFHTPELQEPLSGNYLFYVYIPTYDNKQVEGVISWDDPRTTLMESNSSIYEWYKDNDGIIDQMLNYTLHRGLNLAE